MTDHTVDAHDTATRNDQRQFGSLFNDMPMTAGMFSGVAADFIVVGSQPQLLPDAGTVEYQNGVKLTATGEQTATGNAQWLDDDGNEWETL